MSRRVTITKDKYQWIIHSYFEISMCSLCYFRYPAVQALQALDVTVCKEAKEKADFFRYTLKEVFPYIPKVRSNIFQF